MVQMGNTATTTWAGTLGISAALLFAPVSALAQDQGKPEKAEVPVIFLGAEITPFNAIYVVRKDVNIRAKPTQKSKRIGKLEEGERIGAVGRAKGGWVAYRELGKDIGFVYEPVLYPVIESALAEEITGTLSSGGRPTCEFTLSFVGKTEAEGQIFQIGDYEIDWLCRQNATEARFSTPMFLTEGPSVSNKPALHQMTIDILDLTANLEEVLSTNFQFDHEKMQITFDGITSKRFGRTPEQTQAQVASLSEALATAVTLAYESWNSVLWTELMKRRL